MRASLIAPMPLVSESPLSTTPYFFISSMPPWMAAASFSGLSLASMALAALLSPYR
jgi:hypothetical protein